MLIFKKEKEEVTSDRLELLLRLLIRLSLSLSKRVRDLFVRADFKWERGKRMDESSV